MTKPHRTRPGQVQHDEIMSRVMRRTSVEVVARIAAAEHRVLWTRDIGGVDDRSSPAGSPARARGTEPQIR